MAAEQQRVMKPFRKANRLSKKIKSILEKAEKNKEIGIKITDVVVGGSVAHGTAIPGLFDIDISILSPSLRPNLPKYERQSMTKPLNAEDQKKELRRIELLHKRGLEDIMECLEASLTNHYKIDPNDICELYGNHGRRFKCWHFQVDLTLSAKWDSLEEMCEYLKPLPQNKRKLLSMGITEYHNELLGKQPHRVKVLIKRFKKWKNTTQWPKGSSADGGGCPKSILLSFLVLISYQRAPEYCKTARRLRTLAIWMTENLKDLITEIKENESVDYKVPGENPIVEKYIDEHQSEQRIRDPFNPFRNYYRQGLGDIKAIGGEDIPDRWAVFEEKITSQDNPFNLVMNLT